VSAATVTTAARRRIEFAGNEGVDMWVILLEVALALATLLFIVWWTMFDKPRRRSRRDR
jgi:hypothetical protein